MLVMVVFFIALMCIHLSMPLLRFVLLVLILLLLPTLNFLPFFFSSRRRHTRYIGDWSSDVCSSDLARLEATGKVVRTNREHPPDFINIKVEELTGDKPFDNLDDFITQDELRALSDSYKRIAGFAVEIGRASCRERVERHWGGGALRH